MPFAQQVHTASAPSLRRKWKCSPPTGEDVLQLAMSAGTPCLSAQLDERTHSTFMHGADHRSPANTSAQGPIQRVGDSWGQPLAVGGILGDNLLVGCQGQSAQIGLWRLAAATTQFL